MKLKAYIVDDEIKAIELLRSYIERIDFLELVGDTRNAMTAFSYLQQNTIDILFLDINMPVLTGVDLYKSLVQPPRVIFTTAYPEYAVEGFNLAAVDYLLKPITFPRFLQATNRLLSNQAIHQSTSTARINNIADAVYIKSGAVTHKISWQAVLYLEKDENYVIFHTADKRYLSRQTLSDLEKIFPTYICRIHKSYAISLLHLQEIRRDAVLIANKELPVGRTYRKNLKDYL